jgi:hypothetical protein
LSYRATYRSPADKESIMCETPWPLATTISEIHNPSIRLAAVRAFDIATLAASKAVLHARDPRKFPIGTGKQGFRLERAFLARLKDLPKEKVHGIIEKTSKAVEDGALMRRRYGKLSKLVTFTKKEPVVKQTESLVFPRGDKIPARIYPNLELQDVLQYYSTADQLRDAMIARVPEVTVLQPNNRLDFRINEIKCIDETGAGLFGEIGADEISLGGTVVDAVGKVTRKSPFYVDEFEDDGDRKGYLPPKVFHTFDLLAGQGYPKSFAVMLVLAEKDAGGVAGFIDTLADEVKAVVQRELIKMAGAVALAGGLVAGIVAAVLAAVLIWVLGKVVEWLKDWWGDDIFPVFSQILEVPSLHYTVPEDVTGIANFVGHKGHYQAKYSWRMYAT